MASLGDWIEVFCMTWPTCPSLKWKLSEGREVGNSPACCRIHPLVNSSTSCQFCGVQPTLLLHPIPYSTALPAWQFCGWQTNLLLQLIPISTATSLFVSDWELRLACCRIIWWHISLLSTLPTWLAAVDVNPSSWPSVATFSLFQALTDDHHLWEVTFSCLYG